MTKPIRTYEDLCEEKARLKLLLTAQRELVRQDINAIKVELVPVRKVISMLGKMATKENRNSLLTIAGDTIIDFVVKKMVLSKAGFITKLAVPFFMKNFSSHILADNKDKIISKLSSWFGKKNENGKHPVSAEDKDLAEEQED
ncbi:MAG: hypothetical protein ACXWV6_04005 [Chitinophagaceae bacterium]